VALRTEVLIPAGPQHHQKQAAPFDLHAFQYFFSGIWNQRRLFHRTQPEIARATLLLPPNTSSAKCPLWFTKCADEPETDPCLLSKSGLIRTFGEVSIGLQPYSVGAHSRCMDDAYAKKIKLRAAIHGAFDELQPVGIPFHWTVAPGVLQ